MENKKMLIDSSNPEEIRVAIINNNNLESYDFEVTSKEEVKGNIYLAKVTRVEASLQAAFVEYGRNRQGFLPFSEISIDYFNLPDNIKSQLKAQDAEFRANKNAKKQAELDEDQDIVIPNSVLEVETTTPNLNQNLDDSLNKTQNTESPALPNIEKLSETDIPNYYESLIAKTTKEYFVDLTKTTTKNENIGANHDIVKTVEVTTTEETDVVISTNTSNVASVTNEDANPTPEKNTTKTDNTGKDNSAYGTRFGYKIQDVLNKNDLLLVQVVKDERGNKGASLTTYLSIPGRYCVLMPNSYNTEGGISKKITNPNERTRLKEILNNINIQEGNNIIIRTAGIGKSQAQIQQDYNYITNLWLSIKENSKKLENPALIYEEGNLVKKIIRDSLPNEISEILINTKETHEALVEFAKLIAPDIEQKIKLYKNKPESMFHHFGIEEQIRTIYSPVVYLKSGGYLVIHPTEALTAIDVNSGKFKGNRNIEETALKNNLEAATEVAKHLRLRNIGGLVVIDFIDMENPRNRTLIEKKLKEELKYDTAKIQYGQISSFGLLEMARQHVKSSLFEKSYIACAKCQGMGYIKPYNLNALQILRNISVDLLKDTTYSGKKQLTIKMPSKEAFYVLNNKRDALHKLEQNLGIKFIIEENDNMPYPYYSISEVAKDNNEDSTVLLLETEIAALTKLHKNTKAKPANNKNYNANDKKPNFNNRSSNFKNNSNKKYKNNNTINKNRNIQEKPTVAKKEGWLKKLFKI